MISESLVELSRWQFALTALYHFLFVPLTLGLTFLLAIMETVYSALLVVEMWLMFRFARLGPSSLHTGRYHLETQRLAADDAVPASVTTTTLA